MFFPTLKIGQCTAQDSGVYKCVMKNSFGEIVSEAKVDVEALKPKPKVPPPVVQGPPEVKLVDSDKAILIKVGVKSSDIPEYNWFKDGAPVKADRRIKFDCPLDKGIFYPSMKISQFTEKDSGEYKCVMKNASGEATAIAKVNVDALKPKPKGEAPQITQKLSPKSANDGDKVDFVARVTGTEPLDIQWAFKKKPIKNDDIYNISYAKGVATLKMED